MPYISQTLYEGKRSWETILKQFHGNDVTKISLYGQLAKLIDDINGSGGVNLIKIKRAFDEFDNYADLDYDLPLQFRHDFSIVCQVIEKIIQNE